MFTKLITLREQLLSLRIVLTVALGQVVSNARSSSACGFALSKVKELLDLSDLTSSARDSHDSLQHDTVTFAVLTPIEQIEREMILSTLKKAGGNKTHTAALLGISLKTLHNKLHVYFKTGI